MTEANEQGQPLGLASTAGLGLVERLRQRGNDLRSHPVANSTIDRVEEVGELLHEAADAMRWIPVGERLPEKFTEVLVAFAGQITLASTGQWTGSPHDHKGWCYPVENNGICDDGSDPVVTHWMPLPEVPEGPNARAEPDPTAPPN